MKISIIVPVYNTSNFIEKCLDSILNQTYKDFEIIIINDGSTDDSENVIENFIKNTKEFNNYIYVYQENCGLSEARNTGMKKASGKYIVFIDSDDWIEKNFLEVMVWNIERYNADICMCGYTRRNELTIFNSIIPKNKLVEIDTEKKLLDIYYEAFIENKYGIICCNKIYSKKVINDKKIKFHKNEEIYAEDLLFNSQLISKCNKVVQINETLYNYRMREGSITQSHKPFLEKRYAELVRRLDETINNENLINIIQYEVVNVLSINSYKKERRFINIYRSLKLYFQYNSKLFKQLKNINIIKYKTTNMNKEIKMFLALLSLVVKLNNLCGLSLFMWMKVKIKNN